MADVTENGHEGYSIGDYANQDNIDDAYRDMQEGLCESLDVSPAQDEQAKAEAAWREIQRRDGNAVWHARQWMQAFYVVLTLWGLTACVGLWLYAHSRDVEVVVQTVVYDKEGQFASLGVPQKLLDYTPEDGQWVTMLETWVHKKSWRTDESEAILAPYNWQWLYAHTCGEAAEKLSQEEKIEKPRLPSKLVRSVKIRSTTKTSTPQSFQVIWEETTVDKSKGTKDEAAYTGTFLVGRTMPTTAAVASQNTLGLCITSYDVQKQKP